MADVTVKRIDDMDSLGEGRFIRCRAELGVTSFGFSILNLPPHDENYPEHTHADRGDDDGQEEVYIPLQGSATLIAGGTEYRLEPGVMARVGPSETRRLVTGDDSAQILVIGAVPGKTYQPPGFTEIGAAFP